MLLCDVRHRWAKLTNVPSFFTTGTDEHGLKIQTAAEKQGKDPKAFVDDLAVVFKGLASDSGISYDRFIRTTDEDHVNTVKHFWEILEKDGLIYEGEHEGWYAMSDETFYPASQIKQEADGKWVSIETGSEVKLTSEKNYFFKLGSFRDRIIDHMEKNPNWIIPHQKHQELLNELKSAPLNDLSVSRPSSRLSWGIPVPSDDSQRIYVWIDALVNYLTSAGYPNKEYMTKWPATHLIGKDIIRFHCVYWPALLMAAGVPLPEQVVVHGHWLCEGSKMSKSKGNVVDPLKTMDVYGRDSLRFFLCENSVLNGDNNFSEESLSRSRDLLVDKYSNLVMRVCGKKFNLARAQQNFETLKSIKLEDEALQTQYTTLQTEIDALYSKMDQKMTQFNTSGAISDFWRLISDANQFIQDSEPWKKPQEEKDAIIFIGAEVARVVSILIQPIIPELSSIVLDRLSVEPNRRSVEYAGYRKDLKYGEGANRSGDYPLKKIESLK